MRSRMMLNYVTLTLAALLASMTIDGFAQPIEPIFVLGEKGKTRAARNLEDAGFHRNRQP